MTRPLAELIFDWNINCVFRLFDQLLDSPYTLVWHLAIEPVMLYLHKDNKYSVLTLVDSSGLS